MYVNNISIPIWTLWSCIVSTISCLYCNSRETQEREVSTSFLLWDTQEEFSLEQ